MLGLMHPACHRTKIEMPDHAEKTLAGVVGKVRSNSDKIGPSLADGQRAETTRQEYSVAASAAPPRGQFAEKVFKARLQAASDPTATSES